MRFGDRQNFPALHRLIRSRTPRRKFIELDLSKEHPDELRNVRRRYEFDLGALRPTVMEGANIEYWVEVQDGNNVTGPGVASSDKIPGSDRL